MSLAGRMEIANRLTARGLITAETYIKFLDNQMTAEEETRLLLKLYRAENEKPSNFSIIYNGIKRIFNDIRRNYRRA